MKMLTLVRFLCCVISAAIVLPVTAAPGDVDLAFNPGTDDGASIFAAAFQPDGKLVIGGTFTSVAGVARERIARINASGTLDSGFNPGIDGTVHAVAVLDDGRIIVGGLFNTVAGTPRANLARLNADGSLDTGYNPGASSIVTSFAVQPDGKVVVGGYFTTIGGSARNRLARLNADGTVDSGFNPSVSGPVFTLALQPDGKIVFCGSFSSVSGSARGFGARVNADGSLDSFNPNISGISEAIVVQTDGKIVIGGNTFSTVGGVSRDRFARVNADGSVDLSFTTTASNAIYSLALQADGRLILAGSFASLAGQTRNFFARVLGDGSVDSFHPNASGTGFSAALAADGKVILAGTFTTVGGVSRANIFRADNDAASSTLSVPSQTTVQWLRGGSTPESHQVVFALSTDAGSTWTDLGPGTRISGGWTLSGLALPASGHIRARARVASGRANGSSGLVEKIEAFTLPSSDIAVRGASVIVPNGSTTVTGDNKTNFFDRSICVPGATVHEFTVHNFGHASLSVSAFGKSGPAAADFTIAHPQLPIVLPNQGDFATFTVAFDPSVLGTRTAVIELTHTAPGGPTYTFTVSGNGTGGQLEITGGTPALVIAHNDLAADLADDTDFGDVLVAGSASDTHTFTLTNTGSAPLAINSLVAIPATDFTIVTPPPASPLAPGATAQLQVKFDPTQAGPRHAQIVVVTNDCTRTDTIFAVKGNGLGFPEIEVRGSPTSPPPPQTVIANQDFQPTTVDGTHFGSQPVAAGATVPPRTFTIHNVGDAVLNVTALINSNFAEFPDSGFTPGPIAVGGQKTFQVQFDPSQPGTRFADFTIHNDDANEAPYQFRVAGNGTEPGITVGSGVVPLADGSTTIDSNLGTALGDRAVCAPGFSERTFTIQNPGGAPLEITGFNIAGLHPGDFSIVHAALPITLTNPGDFSQFKVRFDPLVPGLRQAVIEITHNAPGGPVFDFAVAGQAQGAQIALRGGNPLAPIPAGVFSTATANGTLFPTVATAGNASAIQTFTIENSGNAPLVITNIVVNPSTEFSPFGQLPTLVAPFASATFQVKFDPAFPGPRTAQVLVVSNDCNRTDYFFGVEGVGSGLPDIQVRGGPALLVIPAGDQMPNALPDDGTVFADRPVAAGPSTPRVFEIRNLGTGDLHVTGITVDPLPAEFVLGSFTPGVVASGGPPKTFTLAFDPAFPVTRQTDIKVLSDDPDTPTYLFAVKGKGTVVEMTVSGNGQVIADNDTSPTFGDRTDFREVNLCPGTAVTHTFTIRNVGNGPLEVQLPVFSGANPTDFVPGGATFPLTIPGGNNIATFTVTFTPGGPGLRSAMLELTTNDPAIPLYNFLLSGSGVSPDIAVASVSPAAPIVAGTTGVSTATATDFGAQLVGSTSQPRQFTIANAGTGTLLLGSVPNTPPAVTVTGPHATDFLITQPPATSVLSGSPVTFSVAFTPGGSGPRQATIRIASNDCSPAEFTFAVAGTGTGTPAISVEGAGHFIPDGNLAVGTPDGTLFQPGLVLTGASTVHTFTVVNSGQVPLNINAIGSSLAPEFAIAISPPPTFPIAVAPLGGIWSFDVVFDPAQTGPRAAVITLQNDDPDPTKQTYTFVVAGEGLADPVPKPLIAVVGNGVGIPHTASQPGLNDHTQFLDTLHAGNVTSTRTFTIHNAGGVSLPLTGITFGGSHPADFSLQSAPPSSVAAQSAQPFTVVFNPSGPGWREAIVKIANTVPTSTPEYTFAIRGLGTVAPPLLPEIEVTGNGVGIATYDFSPTTGDHTHFGTLPTVATSLERTFTIHNTGTGQLNFGPIGPASSEFIITQPQVTSLAAGDFTTFKVRFDPAQPGLRFLDLAFTTNDADEPTYTFRVSGIGQWGPFTGGGGWLFGGNGWILHNVGSTSGGPLLPLNTGVLGKVKFPVGSGWGANGFGQLGSAAPLGARFPIALDPAGLLGDRRIVAVSGSERNSVALTSEGAVFAWGDNSLGQLGNGSTSAASGPVAVPLTGALAGKSVIALASGRAHTLALCADGTVVAWGENSAGQLGDGSTLNRSQPVPVVTGGALAGKVVVAIAAGERHSVALCADGSLFAWGANASGQLGNGTTTASPVPVAVTRTGAGSPLAGRSVVMIAAGGNHTLAGCADGTVAAWGDNTAGQLGDGSMSNRLVPVSISAAAGPLAGRTVVALAAGATHTLALCADDTLVAWGSNGSGQLGNGSLTASPVPVAVNRGRLPDTTRLVALAAGAAHSLALAADGSLYAWGANGAGQLGTGDTARRSVPTPVAAGRLPAGTRYTALAAGPTADFTLALAALPASAIEVRGPRHAIGGRTGLGGAGDDADFGRVVLGHAARQTFTVVNSGAAPLVLSGNPRAVISGAHAADFSVAVQPWSPLAPGASSAFAVQFAPGAAGVRTAVLTLTTDDPLQPEFAFDLRGTGVALAAPTAALAPALNGAVYATAVQPDRSLVIGGLFTATATRPAGHVARLGSGGGFDPAFAPGPDGSVGAVLVQPDGRLILGGSFTQLSGVSRSGLARVDGNGVVDAGFNPDITGGAVLALAVQPDGKLLVAGGFTAVGGTPRNKLARLLADGSLDPGFNPDVNRTVYAVAVQADGRIVIGGNFDTVGGATRQRLARLLADGTVDAAFNPGATSDVTTLLIQPDQRIVLGGQFTAVGGIPRNRLARLQADGTVDPGFNPDLDTAVYTLALQADGRIVAGGAFTTVGGVERTRVARLNPDGSLDATFAAPASDVVFAVALQADGQVALGGFFTHVGSTATPYLARLANGAAPQSLAVTSAQRVVWLRDGTAPEVQQVEFQLSTDGGATWSGLGAGSRTSGGWELTGLALPASGQVRARGRTVGGAYTGSSGLVELRATFGTTTAPVIVTPPTAQVVAAGGTASFAVVATGNPTPTFQWVRGGAAGAIPIPGATGPVLTLPGVQPAEAGSYAVVVTNAAGTVTSAAASLAVGSATQPPSILAPPTARTVAAGSPTTFAVTATGSPAPTFQWRRFGVPLAGATQASFTLAAVAITDAGLYDVVVANSAGSRVSPSVALEVLQPPAIALPPVGRVATVGAGVAFSVVATGSAPLAYQWSKDNTPLPGATSATLSLASVTAAAAGLYRVTVSNAAGSVTSAPVELVLVAAHASHTVASGGYSAAGTVTIFNTLSFPAGASALGFNVLLPAGWSLGSTFGDAAATRPAVGATDLLEWAWATIPPSPVVFAYTLVVPAGTTGNQTLSALAIVRTGGAAAQLVATPDPLVVAPRTHHTADTDRNYRLDLFELTRVIELFNTRQATVRTGAYTLSAQGEDGFAPDAARPNSAFVPLARLHSADTDQNGRLSLLELTRVIELFNTYTGTVRTGAYRPEAGTEDGYARGP